MSGKACAVFIPGLIFFETVSSGGLSWELGNHLKYNAPRLNGDTHLARFFRGDGPASGKLENSMPGSTFTNFEFSRHTFDNGDDSVTVIVGWYW